MTAIRTGPRVLIVDDEAIIRDTMRRSLEGNGYHVREADCGATALTEFKLFKPDVLLLDLMLPDISGVDVVRQLRQHHASPIIVLSALGDEASKISALDEGADDYLTKPIGMGELLARLRVALRHSTGTSAKDATLILGRLVLDLERRHVTFNHHEVRLTPTEYSLLKFLAMHAGKVLTYKMILGEVWGPGYTTTSVLRTCINQLRAKLDGHREALIRTEPRIGYRLIVTES